MKAKILLWMTLAFITFNGVSIKTSTALPQTIVYVSPELITAGVGDSFTVDIKIANVEWLYGWELYLRWNPDILNLTKVTEGPFLHAEEAYETFFVRKIYNEEIGPEGYNGYAALWCTLKGEPATAAAKGSGILATLTFLVKEEGSSALDLYNTMLRDYDGFEILHTTKDGGFVFLPPKLYVDPPSIVDPTLVSGSTFSVNITIIGVEGLYAWSLYLKWDPTILNVTQIKEGSFLNQSGATDFNVTYAEAGIAYINCTLVGDLIVAAHGNGTLATAIFSVEGYGSTILRLENTTLLHSELLKIPHMFEDGYFKNVLHDIAITSVEALPITAKAGDTISVTVTAKNEGNVAETFEVRAWADNTLIGTKTVTNLSPGDEETLTFDWITEDIAEGEYTIRAEADIILGEINEEDNTRIMEGVVKVTSPQQPFPTTLLIAAVIIVALIVAVRFFYTKRKSSTKA